MAMTAANDDYITDVVRFTEGDCWLLMKRLHRVTGWPCHAFARDYGTVIEAGVHGFVKRPDGFFLDIEGLWDYDAMWSHYEEYLEDEIDIREFPLSEFRWAEPQFGHYSYDRARVVAEELLDRHGREV